jgi:tetratricopeptide (TPR) repeat protein
MKRTIAALAALAMACALSSCGDKGFLATMLNYEARSAKGAPPSSVADLKAGIAKYGDEVDKTAAAMEKIGMYWRLLAIRYMEQGLYGDAYDAAQKALSHFPDYASLYYVSGVSAAFLSRAASAQVAGTGVSRAQWLATAESSYAQAIKIDPGYLKALYGLAVLYSFELENFEAALPPIEKYLAIDTKNVDALFVYARSLYGAGKLQQAADAYDRIISISTIETKKREAADNKKIILDQLYGK